MWSACLSAEEKPITHKKIKQKRLSWAKQHVSWAMDQWNSIMDLMISGMFGGERTKHFIQIASRQLGHSQRAKWSGEAYNAKGLDISNLLQELQMPQFTPASRTSI